MLTRRPWTHMPVVHDLPCHWPRARESEPVDDVVPPPLQQAQQVLARVAGLACRFFHIAAELPLQHAVQRLRLLLLEQLHAEDRAPPPCAPCAAWRHSQLPLQCVAARAVDIDPEAPRDLVTRLVTFRHDTPSPRACVLRSQGSTALSLSAASHPSVRARAASVCSPVNRQRPELCVQSVLEVQFHDDCTRARALRRRGSVGQILPSVNRSAPAGTSSARSSPTGDVPTA